MTTYATSEPPTGDECRISRTVNIGSLTITTVVVSGTGSTTVGTGSGGTDPNTAQRFSVSIG